MKFPIIYIIQRATAIFTAILLLNACGDPDTTANSLLTGTDNISFPEPLKSFATAFLLTPDILTGVQASIQPANDNDLYKWYASAGQSYTVSVHAPQSVRLYIYHADTSRVRATNDDSTTSSDSSISYRCPANGFYYVKVKSFAQNDTFSYSVSLKSGNAFSGGDLYEPDSYGEPIALQIDSPFIYRAISPRYDYDYLTFKERIGLPYLITVINTQKGSRLNIDLNFKYYYDNVYVYDTAVISYISTSNYLPQMTISHYSYYNFDSANVPYKIRVQSANLQNDNYEPDTSDVALAPMYTWQDTGMIRIINKSNDIDWVRIDIPDGYSAKLHIKNYSGSDIIWSCRDTLPYSYSTNNSVYAGSSDSVSLYSSRSYILSMYKYQFSGDSLSSCLVRCKVAKVPQ